MTPNSCEVCDRPRARPEDWERGGREHADCDGADWCGTICWGSNCSLYAVDWRARALAAEAVVEAARLAWAVANPTATGGGKKALRDLGEALAAFDAGRPRR